MRAMVYTAPLELQMLDVEEPELQAGEVLLEVASAGICGSELEGFATKSPRRVPPLVMGHEFSGRILEVGEGVEGFKPGQRVTVNPLITCGQCKLCQMGRSNAYPNRRLTGMHRPGGFAQRVAVPAGQVFPIPDSMTYNEAAMVEPLANGIHAVRLANDFTAENVCVFGAGTIGLLAAQGAKLLGNVRIMLVDVNDRRLEYAKIRSADATVNSKTQDLAKAAQEFTNGNGFDYCIDAAGLAQTRQSSAELLRPGGTAVWIGTHSDETNLSGFNTIHQEKRLQGSYGYTQQDFAKSFQLLSSGGIEIDSWCREFPLEEGVTTFTDLLGGQTEHVKAILQPQ